MSPCRRACLTTAIFNQTARILRMGQPTLVVAGTSPTNGTTLPPAPLVDRFGSSRGKSAYSPTLAPNPERVGKFIVATYPCRVTSNAKPSDQTIADANQARCEWRIYLPLGTGVKPEDRIDVAGRIYEVVDTDAGRADASFLTVFCRSEK